MNKDLIIYGDLKFKPENIPSGALIVLDDGDNRMPCFTRGSSKNHVDLVYGEPGGRSQIKEAHAHIRPKEFQDGELTASFVTNKEINFMGDCIEKGQPQFNTDKLSVGDNIKITFQEENTLVVKIHSINPRKIRYQFLDNDFNITYGHITPDEVIKFNYKLEVL